MPLIAGFGVLIHTKSRRTGIYKLDYNHTDSEIYKDSIEKYNNLRLIFNSDMTFSLSFSVPFMADTVGTWKVGGMDEWNGMKLSIIMAL